jgi:hypothetical protein
LLQGDRKRLGVSFVPTKMPIGLRVVPGLVPGIQVFLSRATKGMDGRHKPGHDGEETPRLIDQDFQA